jgi:hypothetical protein
VRFQALVAEFKGPKTDMGDRVFRVSDMQETKGKMRRTSSCLYEMYHPGLFMRLAKFEQYDTSKVSRPKPAKPVNPGIGCIGESQCGR